MYNKSSSLVGAHCSDTSSSSLFSNPMSVLPRDRSDVPLCQCRPDANGQLPRSSSQMCSFCRSQSIRSSVDSSIYSGSSFLPSSSGSVGLSQLDECNKAEPRRFDSPQLASQHPLLGLGDAEYLAAMRCVVIPVSREFKPDVILISAGFDAAVGHGEALGGYSLSPGLFAWITRQASVFCDFLFQDCIMI